MGPLEVRLPVSIAPPSDIILDVAQAADPQRLQAATTKLATMASSAGGPQVDFASLLANAAARSPTAAAPSTKAPSGSTLMPSQAATVRPQMSPYRKFEAVLLQTFMQEMLPKDSSLFGDAASSDICRSMLAEQLANQLAKSGRIGIAQMIEKAHGPQTVAAAGASPAGAPIAAAAASPAGTASPAEAAPAATAPAARALGAAAADGAANPVGAPSATAAAAPSPVPTTDVDRG